MLSIIFPVYNEEKRLPNSLEKIKAYFSNVNYPYELIFVNDGSADQSQSVILNLFQDPALKGHALRGYSLTHAQNLGKGAAIRTGVEKAGGDWILFMDIDLAVPLSTIDLFLKKQTESLFLRNQTADLLIGSRRTTGARILTHQSWLRETLGRGFTRLSNLILETNYTDLTCGFKMIKTSVAKQLFALQKMRGWTFDSEILFLAKKKGCAVKELPVDWSDVKGSKVKFPKDLIQSFIDLLKIRFYNLKSSYSPM